MRAEEVADQCLYESGARGVHPKAREITLIGLMLVPDGAISMRTYRKRIRETYLNLNPEAGSFFVIFVLPILISLVSNWIAKWILNRTDLKTIMSQAFDALVASSPSVEMRLISISTTVKAQADASE